MSRAACWNVAPNQPALVIRRYLETGERHLDQLQLGLIPHFTKDLKAAVWQPKLLCKARTVAQSPADRQESAMDALAALRLQIEWGADEALADAPVDRLRSKTPDRPPSSEPPPATPAPATRATPLDRARNAAANAETLDALKQAIAAFDGCVLRDTAANTVLPEGSPAEGSPAEGPPGWLLVIGEAPSADDDRAGRPFAGPAGAYLDKLLASIGLQRDALLLAPLVPWRPPGDRPPSQTELAVCLPFLMRLINLSRPTLLLVLGSLASRTLIGSAISGRIRRGTWIDLPVPELGTVRTLSTHSVAALLGQPGLRRDAWADLRAIRRALDAQLAAK